MRVGIEYSGDTLATYADGKTPIGPERLYGIARTAKARDITWGSFDPIPGLGRYNWTALDELMRAWAAAGVFIDCIVVRCQHLLAVREPLAMLQLQSSPPKNERMWTAWGAAIRALADRLHAFSPVHVALEIESEADWCWRGSVEEYLRLLSIAYDVTREFNTTVVLAGINVAGLLVDDPSDDDIAARVLGLPDADRDRVTRSIAFYERTLREGHYTAAGFHSLHQPDAIGPTVKRMRALMPAARAVWADDAFPATSLNYDSYRFNAPAKRAVMEARIDALDRGDKGAHAELDAEKIETTHARLIAMADAGVECCYIGPIRDWSRAIGQPWMGLLDASGTPRPVCDVVRAAQ